MVFRLPTPSVLVLTVDGGHSLTAPLAPLAPLAAPSCACLKRPCSHSQPKTEADEARIGAYTVVHIYIYIYTLLVPAQRKFYTRVT